MKSTRIPRLGVIGAGYWGKNLIRNCAELGVLTAIYDPSVQAMRQTRDAYPHVHSAHDVDDLLRASIDAVVIAAPAETHARLALQSIAAGKHVFVEKPLALRVEDGLQVARAAKAAGVSVFVGHLLLYHPAVRRLRTLVKDGAVGQVWHIRSRRVSLGKLRMHESVWWSFAPHDVALTLAIMNDRPLTASAAQSGHLLAGIWDAAYADFQFGNGRSAHVEVNWLDPHKNARLDVFGTNGVLTLEDSRSGSKLQLQPCGVGRGNGGAMETWRGEPMQIPVADGEPLRAELQAFLESVQSGIPAETNVDEGIEVLRALAMADQAALRSQAQLEAFV